MVKSQPIIKYILRMTPIVALVATLSACSSPNSSNRQNTQNEKWAVDNKNGLLFQASQDEFETMVRTVSIKSKILEQYADWRGVRYRLGGSSKRGIDCSAFVQRTFREQFGMDLPRSTSAQQVLGQKIQRKKLRPGDLVLFHAGSTGRHVGIYLGNDKFVHASTRVGVTISSLNDQYWNKRYRDARRVLNSASQS